MRRVKIRIITALILIGVVSGEIVGPTALIVRADETEMMSESIEEIESVLETETIMEPETAWEEESEETVTKAEPETVSNIEVNVETESETIEETFENVETESQPETEIESETVFETESEQILDTGIASGDCGDSVTWVLSEDGILTLAGSGSMTDYDSTNAPWKEYVSSIKKIQIGEGVTSIGTLAFYNCYNLNEVTFPKTLSKIGEAAFYGCVSLSAIEIPGGVQVLEDAAFAECRKLTTITLNNGLQSIGEYVFQGCTSLISLHVPASVTSAAWGNMFFNCSNIQTVSIDSQNNNFKAIDNVVFSADGMTLLLYPVNRQASSYTIPFGVEVIASYAFSYNTNLVNVEMPSTLTEIQEWAFYSSELQHITIPDSVVNVSYGIFDSCSNLKEVVIGNGITELSYRMFENCSSLTNVTLGNGLKTIGNKAFCQCSALENIVIPEGVTIIEGQAFYGCTSLTRIVIPDSVEELGENVFEQCAENIEILYPDTLVENGSGGYISGTTLRVSGTRNYDYANQVLNIVNRERVAQGLAELTMDADLLEAAMVRASEIHMYFSHTRPNGSSCFTACEKMSGENIAAGNRTPESVMQSWMNSPGHKANILTESYKSIGIGCFVQDGVMYWVQCFGRGAADLVSRTGSESVETDILIKSRNLLLYSTIDDTVTLCEGEDLTIDIDAEYDDDDGWNDAVHVSPQTFTWMSSNSKAASVDVAGNVKYVNVGTTVISASINGQTLKQWTVNTRKNIANASISSISDYTYSGQACTPKVILKTGSVQLKEGQDYTVEYQNNVNAGTAKAVITGIGNYAGQVITNFKINPLEVKDVKITYRGSRAYSLSTMEIMQNLSIIVDNRKLSADDFWMNGAMYSSSGSSENGYILDTIYISYRGNYSGSDTVDVDIASMAIQNLRATAFGKNKVCLNWAEVPGAQGYIISAQKNGVYKKIGYTTNKYYIDTSALDTDYNFYWVFPYAVDAKGRANVGDYVKYVYAKGVCPAVTNLKASSVSGGVKLTWTASSDAEGYLVYGIVNGGSYKYIGMTTKGTAFTDTKASKTVYNYYWVFPYHKDSNGKMIVGGTAPYTYGRAK